MRLTDKNVIAEDILVLLLATVYGYTKLRNLNTTEGENYPGIDLGDDEARIAFQVTATPDSEKVKNTLQKFVEHRQYERYDSLFIYILSEKQSRYSGKGFENIINGLFTFDKDKAIIDYRDLLKAISGLPLVTVRRVENILEEHFGQKAPILFGVPYTPRTETVYLNLLECGFPKTIYVADLNLPTKRDFGQKQFHNRQGYARFRHLSQRERAKVLLDEMGHRFGVDWECHAGQLITFHNLEDDYMPLAQIVDAGTITAMKTHELYGIDEEYEKVFKHLLRRCLQQKLYQKRVQWQHEQRLFIFVPLQEGDTERKVKWSNKKQNERTVFERTMHKDDPSKTWYCKHLAIDASFRNISGQWYLSLQPDWFFSSDGYKKYRHAAEKVTWLKRKETNSHVYNHLMFLAHFIKAEEHDGIFDTKPARIYPFLTFGNLLSFDNADALDDSAWLPPKKEEEESIDEGGKPRPVQQVMDLEI